MEIKEGFLTEREGVRKALCTVQANIAEEWAILCLLVLISDTVSWTVFVDTSGSEGPLQEQLWSSTWYEIKCQSTFMYLRTVMRMFLLSIYDLYLTYISIYLLSNIDV